MSRYIDADLLKDKTTRVNNIWNVTTNAEGKGLDEIIDNIPTADVRENVRGEWKVVVEPGLCDLRRCSNCGHIEAVGLEMITPKPNYCPNCGADMRGETT